MTKLTMIESHKYNTRFYTKHALLLIALLCDKHRKRNWLDNEGLKGRPYKRHQSSNRLPPRTPSRSWSTWSRQRRRPKRSRQNPRHLISMKNQVDSCIYIYMIRLENLKGWNKISTTAMLAECWNMYVFIRWSFMVFCCNVASVLK